MTVREAIDHLRVLPPGLELRAIHFDFMTGVESFHEAAFRDTRCVAEGDSEPTACVLVGPREQVFEQRCRVCGCTNEDCSQCVEKTGDACSWVEEDLCSACVPQGARKAKRARLGKGGAA